MQFEDLIDSIPTLARPGFRAGIWLVSALSDGTAFTVTDPTERVKLLCAFVRWNRNDEETSSSAYPERV